GGVASNVGKRKTPATTDRPQPSLPTPHSYRGPYDLTEDQELFKRTIHEFAEREILPIAAELDEKEHYPRETVAKMADLGLLAMLSPETSARAATSPPPPALA